MKRTLKRRTRESDISSNTPGGKSAWSFANSREECETG